MGYFRELPSIEYESFLSNETSTQKYLLVKNLFRRSKLREDLQNNFTVFQKYHIEEGVRPDIVAEELYGDPELDWVVMLTANIVNVRNDWPLSNRDLYNLASEKYGTDLNSLHHYETVEIKDSLGRVVLPAGKTVDSNFIFTYTDPDTNLGTRTFSASTVRLPITNYEYEILKNEEKSLIYLLKPGYIQQFLNDMRNIMTYNKSSEYVTDRIIRTENTKNI